jgi:hypothetical protein
MLSGPAMNSIKLRVRELLSGFPGVRAVGFGWDPAGNQVLNVDVDPQTDSSVIERRLMDVDAQVRVRKVSGTVSAGVGPSRS